MWQRPRITSVCMCVVTWWRQCTAVLHWLSESSIFQQQFWRHTSCPRGSSPSGRLLGPLPHPDWLTGQYLEKVRETEHREPLLVQLLTEWCHQCSPGNCCSHWWTRPPPDKSLKDPDKEPETFDPWQQDRGILKCFCFTGMTVITVGQLVCIRCVHLWVSVM